MERKLMSEHVEPPIIDAELKSCPFCGSDDIEQGHTVGKREEEGYTHATGCNNCDATSAMMPTMKEANEKWNIRV